MPANAGCGNLAVAARLLTSALVQGYAREIQADICSILHPALAKPSALNNATDVWPHEKWYRFFAEQEEKTRQQRQMTQPAEFSNQPGAAEFLLSAKDGLSVGDMGSAKDSLLDTCAQGELEMIQASAWPRVAQLFHSVHARGHHYVIAS